MISLIVLRQLIERNTPVHFIDLSVDNTVISCNTPLTVCDAFGGM